MQDYQLTLVLTEAAAKDAKTAQALYTGLVESVKGKVKKINELELKEFAYRLKKAQKGGYIFGLITLDPLKTASLDRLVRQNEAVLRHLLIKDKE